jgi:hypothetical protein
MLGFSLAGNIGITIPGCVGNPAYRNVFVRSSVLAPGHVLELQKQRQVQSECGLFLTCKKPNSFRTDTCTQL